MVSNASGLDPNCVTAAEPASTPPRRAKTKRRKLLLMAIALFCLAGWGFGLYRHFVPATVSAPSRASFQARIEERSGLDAATSRCITDKVYTSYNNAAIVALYDDGIVGLPVEIWGPYGLKSASCLYANDPTTPR